MTDHSYAKLDFLVPIDLLVNKRQKDGHILQDNIPRTSSNADQLYGKATLKELETLFECDSHAFHDKKDARCNYAEMAKTDERRTLADYKVPVIDLAEQRRVQYCKNMLKIKAAPKVLNLNAKGKRLAEKQLKAAIGTARAAGSGRFISQLAPPPLSPKQPSYEAMASKKFGVVSYWTRDPLVKKCAEPVEKKEPNCTEIDYVNAKFK